MSLRDMLNLVDEVTVETVTESVDGNANVSSATASTTISRAAIWQTGGSNAVVSDKIARNSSHVMAIESSERTFVTTDDLVTYDGETFRVTGRPDDVMQRGELTVVGLELIE